MTAKDYPVTFPYGATTAPYTPAKPHTGEDRKMPLNTPIEVNGVLVGYAGTTGKSTGVHTHTQKVLNGQVVHPKGGGFDVPQPTKVVAVGYSDSIGNYVRYMDGNGATWSIFHMNKPALVSVGQQLKQENNMPTIITDQHIGLLRIAHSEIGGWNLHEVHAGLHDATFLGAWKGRTVDELIWAQWNEKNAEAYRNQREANKAKIVELQTALANEQAKPAKEIIKEVVTIVEKPVEVIKIQEVPAQVDEKQVVTNWFKRIWESLFKKG